MISMDDLLLRGGKALIGLDARPFSRDVLIRDGKIVSIAQTGELNEFENSARVVDARGSPRGVMRPHTSRVPANGWGAIRLLPP